MGTQRRRLYARVKRALWRAVRVLFTILAGASPGIPPPPPPPPQTTEQIADGAPDELPP